MWPFDSKALTRYFEDHLENYLKYFPVTILELIFFVFGMPREVLRGRLLVRLCKFECIRIFFKELRRKLNLPWQLPA